MGKSEVIIFIVLINIIILIFIAGIILFVMQYRKRKLQYEKEKSETERKHQLNLLHEKVQAQQQTMQVIGSELHDSVAQKLTLASIYTQQMEYENKYPEMLDKLSGISNIINDSLIEMRDLAKTLAGNDLQDEELISLLRKEAARVNGTGICQLHINDVATAPMGNTVKRFLLRVLQEFIQNSIKHSECSAININISSENDGLAIVASDNGKGFDEGALRAKGMGLSNMQRRVQLIGGIFNLESSPGHGAVLKIFIDGQKLMA